MLVLIASQWKDMVDESGRRRLDNPDDVVRREIELGLQLYLPVIPVLIDGATLPKRKNLLESIQRLYYRQGLVLRNSADFGNDIRKLIDALLA
jgi:hypothetical protein